jgi:hypothetical protein
MLKMHNLKHCVNQTKHHTGFFLGFGLNVTMLFWAMFSVGKLPLVRERLPEDAVIM